MGILHKRGGERRLIFFIVSAIRRWPLRFEHKPHTMTRYSICLIALLCIIAASSNSCKKEKSSPAPVIDSPVAANYTEMKAGNYWIYQEYEIDSPTATPMALGIYDSTYVAKDTTINSLTYHEYVEHDWPDTSISLISYVRDSLTYLVNSGGKILFSSTDFTDTFSSFDFYNPAVGPDTIPVVTKMGCKDSLITVDAGTFTTVSLRQMWFIPSGFPFGPVRFIDRRYAINTGMVAEQLPFYQNEIKRTERRLVRYHVQ
jgi:hypothetical protein